MASVKDIVFDSPHPASAARFWAQVLDGYEIAPYDEGELARLRSIGINNPEYDPSVLLIHADGRLPRFFFQLVPEGKWVKNRVHLDLSATDTAAEVDRLCALGATVHAERDDWITMRDPDGNEFCLIARERHHIPAMRNSGDRATGDTRSRVPGGAAPAACRPERSPAGFRVDDLSLVVFSAHFRALSRCRRRLAEELVGLLF